MVDPDDNSANNSRGRNLKPLISIAVVLLVVTGLYFVVRAMPVELLGRLSNLEPTPMLGYFLQKKVQ